MNLKIIFQPLFLIKNWIKTRLNYKLLGQWVFWVLNFYFENGFSYRMKCFEGQENYNIFDTMNRIAKSSDEIVDSLEPSSGWTHFEDAERSLAGRFDKWQLSHLGEKVGIWLADAVEVVMKFQGFSHEYFLGLDHCVVDVS